MELDWSTNNGDLLLDRNHWTDGQTDRMNMTLPKSDVGSSKHANELQRRKNSQFFFAADMFTLQFKYLSNLYRYFQSFKQALSAACKENQREKCLEFQILSQTQNH